MGKWVVIYTSITGNTEKIANAIAEAANADIFKGQDMPQDLSGYEVVVLGYWMRRGAPDPLMQKLLPMVHDTKVVLFQTHGTEVGSEHAVTAFARAGYLLGKGCDILGTFSSQGKINPKLIELRKAKGAKDDPHCGERAQMRWAEAALHPNEEDMERAKSFVRSMQRKLELRAEFQASCSHSPGSGIA